MTHNPSIIVTDLFCGGGGCTVGFEAATVHGQKVATVAAALNHDPIAIASHARNHPHTLHLEADIRKVDERQLPKKSDNPGKVYWLHASLECTNFSNAKGGMPRNEDSRTLAWEMPRFVRWQMPDYISIENVPEFRAWGPLDEKGKPVSKDKGEEYLKWVEAMKALGYTYEYRLLNAADFGAYTSRKRYFAIFARHGLPIVWPDPTHDKTRWMPVRDVLDLNDHGLSIFGRKKPLVDRTLKRILAGLNKYVANGESEFITKWRGHKGENMTGSVSGTSDSCPVITTMNHLGLTQVKPVCLTKYYGQGGNISSIDAPAGTVTTKDRMMLLNAQWLDKNYSGAHNHQPLDKPAGAVCTSDKHAQVTAQYLLNPQYNNKGNSLDKPSPVILARSDKKPLSLVSAPHAAHSIHWHPQAEDSETMLAIRAFMAEHGIADILMRMLKVPELMRITGFPEGYQLLGSQTKQKSMIGNAQPPIIPQRLVEAIATELQSSKYRIAV